MLQRRIFILFVLTCLLMTGLAPVQAESLASPVHASTNYFWAKSMGGVSWDKGYSIAVDSSSNVYTTGSFWGTADFDPSPGVFNLTSVNIEDIFVSKLDSSGNFVWAKSMGGLSEDVGVGIAVDSSGNVYTTGHFVYTVDFDPGSGTFNLNCPGLNYCSFVSKLDSSGNFVWAKSMVGDGSAYGTGIAIDSSSGNVYTTGLFHGTADFGPFNLTSAGNFDIFVSKLDSSGNFLWAKNMGGTGYDASNSLAVDSSGNVYTTGQFSYTAEFNPGAGTFTLTAVSDFYPDIFVSKLDSSGNFVWAKSMGGVGVDVGTGIAVDSSSGNVYTTGLFHGTADFDPSMGTFNLTNSAGDYINFVSKLDSSGNFVWAKSLGEMGSEYGPSGIALDSSGNVYTTGDFVGTADFDPGAGTFNLTSAGYEDIFISKLNSSGSFVWAKGMDGSHGHDFGRGIAADSSGNIYTTGEFEDTVDFYPGPGKFNLTSASPDVTDIFVYKPENLGVTPAITGKVYNDSAAAGNEVAGAFIQACLTGGGCQMTTSDSDGSYGFIGLDPGQYRLLAFPPAGNDHLSGSRGPLTLLENSKLLDQNIILLQPTPLPAGTTITPARSTSGGVPFVYWQDPFILTTTGCSGGTAGYQVFSNGAFIRSGSMVESPAGTYTAMVASPYPNHGDASVIITLQCPGGEPTHITFNIWIDPSGVVVDTNGDPVSGATVTLYRADVAYGPFDIVASGSGVMSPGNRVNPMQTDAAGLFGWDVIAGYYKVRAEKSGCVAADNHSQPYAQTEVLTIPPPVTDLRLVLYCGEQPLFHIYLPLVIR